MSGKNKYFRIKLKSNSSAERSFNMPSNKSGTSGDDEKLVLKLSELFSFIDNFDGKLESYRHFRNNCERAFALADEKAKPALFLLYPLKTEGRLSIYNLQKKLQ